MSLSAVESWSKNGESDMDKVHFEHINKLLKHDPVPCNEPGSCKLKVDLLVLPFKYFFPNASSYGPYSSLLTFKLFFQDYAEAARMLVQDINDVLSKHTLSVR